MFIFEVFEILKQNLLSKRYKIFFMIKTKNSKIKQTQHHFTRCMTIQNVIICISHANLNFEQVLLQIIHIKIKNEYFKNPIC